ncbi:hypothetical protein ACFL6Y_05440 [Elusimicrobiota bacterium]
MKDKIELLEEETGASPQEAELALGLAAYDMEEAIRILQEKMRDVFVIKVKIMRRDPCLYGMFMLIVNVDRRKGAPTYRTMFILSSNPHVYETNLELPWYDFEKEIYRFRLAEGSFIAASQRADKALENAIESSLGELVELKTALEQNQSENIRKWILRSLAKAGFMPETIKFKYQAQLLNLQEFKHSPFLAKTPEPVRSPKGEIFLKLRIALSGDIHEQAGVKQKLVPVEDIKVGDTVYVYIIESREISSFLAELLGGISEEGFMPIAAPVDSVWDGADGEKAVRVRFGHSVVGDGVFPGKLNVCIEAGITRDESAISRFLKSFYQE